MTNEMFTLVQVKLMIRNGQIAGTCKRCGRFLVPFLPNFSWILKRSAMHWDELRVRQGGQSGLPSAGLWWSQPGS